jgi:hypothetical protein
MWFAVCDASIVTGLELADNGNGICKGQYSIKFGSQYERISFNCTVEHNLFGGQKCKTYTGAIELDINYGGTQSSDVQKWLTNVGLGDLVTAGKRTCIAYGCTRV